MTGAEIKALRLSKGVTVLQAADLCEVAYSTFHRWEAGKRAMPTAYELLFRTRIKAHGTPDETIHPWPAYNIVALREALNYTQQDLATSLGVSRTTVYLWECSQTRPSPQHCETLDQLKGEIR